MWISKKKWTALEKRIADLESQVQNQPTCNPSINIESDNALKVKRWVKEALRDAISCHQKRNTCLRMLRKENKK